MDPLTLFALANGAVAAEITIVQADALEAA